MKSLTIQPNDAGQRLDKFLTKTFRSLPPALMYKAIRTKNIKLNGKRCAVSTRLEAGDTLTLYLKDDVLEETPAVYDFLSASRRLDIVYEDDNLLLLNKKAGLLVHPDDREYRDTLIARVQRYLYEKGSYDPAAENSFAPALCNRIDRNTGGIVIAAKNAETLRILNEKIKLREINKYYLCLVHGSLRPRQGTLKNYIIKDPSQKMVSVYDKMYPGALTAITDYRVLKEAKGLSLVECLLHTGRTHQIRAQMAHAGHPLAGDTKYGLNKNNRSLPFRYQALYSYRLDFTFKTSAGILEYLKNRSFSVMNIPFVNYLGEN